MGRRDAYAAHEVSNLRGIALERDIMDLSVQIYIFIGILVNGFLAFIWDRRTWGNVFIKMGLAVLTFYGIFLLAQANGYIIKV